MNGQLYTQQLNAILSSLDKGDRAVHIESYSWLIWPVTIGLLILFTDYAVDLLQVYTDGSNLSRNIVTTLFVSTVLILVSVTDHVITHYAKQSKDETFSQLHKQLNRVIWLIVGCAILLLAFAQIKLRLGPSVFGFYIVLYGLGLYAIGLFSDKWLRWVGSSVMIFGVIVLFSFRGASLNLLTGSAFLFFGPYLFFLKNRVKSIRFYWLSIAGLFLGITLSFIIAKNIHYQLAIDASDLPLLSLQSYKNLDAQAKQGRYAVRLEKGTDVPMTYDFSSNLLDQPYKLQWNMRLARAMDIVLENGNATGVYRVVGENWKRRREHFYQQRFVREQYVDPEQGILINRKLTLHSDGPKSGILP